MRGIEESVVRGKLNVVNCFLLKEALVAEAERGRGKTEVILGVSGESGFQTPEDNKGDKKCGCAEGDHRPS